MSGGSMNYLYSRIESDANFCTDTPMRKAFAAHLMKVTRALHDIEWVDSGDYGPGDDVDAIRECIGDAPALEVAIAQARESITAMFKEINHAVQVLQQSETEGEMSKEELAKLLATIETKNS